MPVIRYAEALARQSTPDLVSAAAVLAAVRQRSDATYAFTAAAVGTASALTSAVWVERRIELLGEGFRSSDLLRNLLTIPVKGPAPASAPGQPEYIFSIPNAEISSNKLL